MCCDCVDVFCEVFCDVVVCDAVGVSFFLVVCFPAFYKVVDCVCWFYDLDFHFNHFLLFVVLFCKFFFLTLLISIRCACSVNRLRLFCNCFLVCVWLNTVCMAFAAFLTGFYNIYQYIYQNCMKVC